MKNYVYICSHINFAFSRIRGKQFFASPENLHFWHTSLLPAGDDMCGVDGGIDLFRLLS